MEPFVNTADSAFTEPSELLLNHRHHRRHNQCTTTTVKDGIESLWRCSSAENAVTALRQLEGALSRNHHPHLCHHRTRDDHGDDDDDDDHDLFDASEAFLAIQGAVLRFSSWNGSSAKSNSSRHAEHTEDPGGGGGGSCGAAATVADDADDVQLRHEALRAAATLAEIHVGPAWWLLRQQQQQRRAIRHRDSRCVTLNEAAAAAATCRTAAAANDDDDGDRWSVATDPEHSALQQMRRQVVPSSFVPVQVTIVASPGGDRDNDDDSVMSCSVASHNNKNYSNYSNNNRCNHSLHQQQHVPEVLPAAMIRFAADVRNNSKREMAAVAHQQIKLVLALCCCDEEEELVPSLANRQQRQWDIPGIESIVCSMLLSWLETLATSEDGSWESMVVSTCRDLLGAGLFLPPTVASTVVDSLLAIIAKRTNDGGLYDSIDDDVPPLQAESMAVVCHAISTIALAASIMIPQASVELVVRAFCRLHVYLLVSSKKISVVPSTPQQLQRVEQQTGHDYRYGESEAIFGYACLNEIWHSLLVLLHRDVSSESAIQTLLSVVDSEASTWKDERHAQSQKRAALALGVICDSLWKDESSEGPRGDASLRVYWRSAIECIRTILSFTFERLVETVTDSRSEDYEDLTSLATSAVSCLHLVVQRENKNEEGVLSQLEWDDLVACLVGEVLPWLSQLRSSNEHFPNILESSLALAVEFSGILQTQTVSITSFYLDPVCQKTLYSMLLRGAVPLLNECESRALGSVVLRCWYKPSLVAGSGSATGYETVTDLLNEVFRRSSSDTYVHMPCIRCEGIEILGAHLNDVRLMLRECDSSEDSAQRDDLLQILCERKQLDNFIEVTVLPLLRSLLSNRTVGENSDGIETTSHEESTLYEHGSVDDEIEDIIRFLSKSVDLSPKCDMDMLELRGVSLAGALFRRAAISRSHRDAAASILRSVVLNQWTELDPQEDPNKARCTFSSRIAAVAELGQCLVSSFDQRRCYQGSIAFLIETLCAVVNKFTSTLSSKDSFVHRIALMVFAVDALSRLRLTNDCHLECILGQFEYNRVDHVVRRLFLGSVSYPSTGSVNRLPVLDSVKLLKPVIESLVSFICESSRLGSPTSRIFLGALSCLRKTCYDFLGALACSKSTSMRSSGLGFNLISVFDDEEGDQSEITARNAVIRRYVEQSFLLARDLVTRQLPHFSISSSEAIAYARSLYDLHLRRLRSTSDKERIVACSLLPSLLPAIHSMNSFDPGTGVLDDLFSALQELVCSTRERFSTASESLISTSIAASVASVLDVIHDIMFLDVQFDLPEELQKCSFHLCYDIVLKTQEFRESYVCHLALRCASALVDCMNTIAINSIVSNFEGSDFRESSMSKIVAELLNRGRCQTDGKVGDSRSASKHDEIAMETENIDRFEVNEETDAFDPSFAAWLYDDGFLLTCRVGSAGSRYSGWTEIIIRTATARHRSLVRTPASASLELPDFPSSMWIPPSVSTTNMDTERCDNPIPLHVSIGIEVLSSRFDSMMQDSSDDDSPPCKSRSGSPAVHMDQNYATDTIVTPAGDRGSPQKDHASLNDAATWLHFGFAEEEKIANFANGLFLGKTARPRRLAGPTLGRAISVLDRTTEMDTHKIALLYDRSPITEQKNQSNEAQLLTSTNFSPAFQRFAEGLGKSIPTHQLKYFSAGLDTKCSNDGDLTVAWIDEDPRKTSASTSMVVFHVVSLMPACIDHVNRKRHVGNDNVVILFSDEPDATKYDLLGHNTTSPVIGGAFGFVTILVTSPASEVRRVSLRIRHFLPQILNDTLDHLVCDHEIHSEDASMFVRCLAMRADLACRAAVDTLEPPSICLERSRRFLEMRRYVVDDTMLTIEGRFAAPNHCP